MNHILLNIYEVLSGFEFYMHHYFTLIVVLSIIDVAILVEVAAKVRALRVTSAGLAAIYSVFVLCEWTNITAKLMTFVLFGRFNV